MEWSSPSGLDEYGVFVYFGNISVQNLKYFDALVDPDLPKWLKEQVTGNLPTALTRLESETGVALKKRMFVLISRWPNPIDRQRFMGSASDR